MKKSCFSVGALTFCILAVTILVGLALLVTVYFPYNARELFGPPVNTLSVYQKLTYPFQLVMGKDTMLAKVDPGSTGREFSISQGQTVDSIAIELQQIGLISDSGLFRIYLIYSGMDRGIQAGDYVLKDVINSVDLAKMLQDATPKEIQFNILLGWRLEEIAASLQTSGLALTPEQFLGFTSNPGGFVLLPELAGIQNLEGYLLPGEYTISRETGGDQIVQLFLDKFAKEVTPDIRQAYINEGLSLQQAVILASLIQREAIHKDEMPLIASVFLNRLSAGMKFDSDASVQFAIGFDPATDSWWKNPLTLQDLQVNSPYNTYLFNGFPPGPICNPGMAALKAVAYPAQSPYYYFRAKCDKSGYHNFAETFTQQQQNACP